MEVIAAPFSSQANLSNRRGNPAKTDGLFQENYEKNMKNFFDRLVSGEQEKVKYF
jgi:hypothetical protein